MRNQLEAFRQQCPGISAAGFQDGMIRRFVAHALGLPGESAVSATRAPILVVAVHDHLRGTDHHPEHLTASEHARSLSLRFHYAWLIGDGDLHTNNVSVLQGADGRAKNLRRRRWQALADAIRLPQRRAPAAGTSPCPPARRGR